MKCYEYETDKIVTTGGDREKIRVCFCGTTACKNLPEIKGYELPEDFICECGKHKRKNGKWIVPLKTKRENESN